MSYVAIYNAAIDEAAVLRKQTAVAIRKAAMAVINDNPGPANQARRLAWANQVMSPNGVTVMADAMIWSVLDNVTVQANPNTQPDDTIQFVVNGLVDQFAGT
jgi:hypothetical protein